MVHCPASFARFVKDLHLDCRSNVNSLPVCDCKSYFLVAGILSSDFQDIRLLEVQRPAFEIEKLENCHHD